MTFQLVWYDLATEQQNNNDELYYFSNVELGLHDQNKYQLFMMYIFICYEI